MIKNFRNDYVGSSFSIQVLEIFEGNGYVNGTVCPIAQEQRLEREDHWMNTLRTKYAYAQNDRARDEDTNIFMSMQF